MGGSAKKDSHSVAVQANLQNSTDLNPTVTDTDLVAQFEPVGGGINRGCRGSDQHDNSQTYYMAIAETTSLDDCKLKCAQRKICTGIEYSNFGRCELWAVPVTT